MKMYNYVLLSATIMLTLSMMGFTFTATSWTLDKMGLGDISNINTSAFAVAIAALFALGIAGAMIGVFFNISPIFALKGTYILPLFTLLVMDFVKILTFPTLEPWAKGILSLIFVPLIGGFFVSLVEMWEGRD